MTDSLRGDQIAEIHEAFFLIDKNSDGVYFNFFTFIFGVTIALWN